MRSVCRTHAMGGMLLKVKITASRVLFQVLAALRIRNYQAVIRSAAQCVGWPQ